MVACDNGHVPVWRIGETVHAVFTVFHVRWNCACGVPECKGRNVIFENDDDETDTSRYDGTQSVERFVEHSLPFTCSEEDVRAVVDAGPWEYPS